MTDTGAKMRGKEEDIPYLPWAREKMLSEILRAEQARPLRFISRRASWFVWIDRYFASAGAAGASI